MEASSKTELYQVEAMASSRVHPLEYDKVVRKIRPEDFESVAFSVVEAFPELRGVSFNLRYFDTEVDTWIDLIDFNQFNEVPNKAKLRVVTSPIDSSTPTSSMDSTLNKRCDEKPSLEQNATLPPLFDDMFSNMRNEKPHPGVNMIVLEPETQDPLAHESEVETQFYAPIPETQEERTCTDGTPARSMNDDSSAVRDATGETVPPVSAPSQNVAAAEASGISRPVNLQRLSNLVRSKLISGQSFTRSDWSCLCSAVFEELQARGIYYPKNYTSLAYKVLLQYPRLRGDLTEERAMDIIQLKLKCRFKNARKKSVSPLVAAVREQHKRKRSRGDVSDALPGYLPPVTASTVQTEAAIHALKGEGVAKEEIVALMAKSFPARRRDIAAGMTLRKLKKTYPRLFCFDLLVLEMQHIAENSTLGEEAEVKLNSWLQLVQNATGAATTEAAVESLLRILEESAVILDCEHESKLPHIVTHTENSTDEAAIYEVLVEKVTVVKVTCLTSAVLVFGMLFFIFNQKTHRTQKNVNWFLRTHVLSLPCEHKPSAAAAKAIDELELQAVSPK